MWKVFLAFSSKECTRVSTRIFLVPVSVGQPNTQNLRETEEQADAPDKPQNLSGVSPDDRSARRAGVAALHTASQTGLICVKTPEPTAVQIPLDVITGTCCIVPTNFQKLTLLLLVQG